jgi:hypothetical protein
MTSRDPPLGETVPMSKTVADMALSSTAPRAELFAQGAMLEVCATPVWLGLDRE